jgi:RimJ/RimL family protein N-acetyltransferase
MKINKSVINGVSLVLLDSDSIEQLRVWRNDDSILRFMDYKETISAEQQKRWFEKIQNTRNQYFMVHFNGEPIGMTHLDRFDDDNKAAYAGLFIGDKSFVGTGVALSASVLILDKAFFELNLETISAKVNKDNFEAINYNKAIGFTEDGLESEDFLRLSLKCNTYLTKREFLVKLLSL